MYPWHSSSASQWKRALVETKADTQAVAELLAQASARTTKCLLRMSWMALFIPGAHGARCVACNLPCVVDDRNEAMLVDPCLHLIHSFCHRVCGPKCPSCNSAIQPAQSPPTPTMDLEFLELEASYRMAQSDCPRDTVVDLMASINSADFADGMPTLSALWCIKETDMTAVEQDQKARALQEVCATMWRDRLEDYRRRAELQLEETGPVCFPSGANATIKLESTIDNGFGDGARDMAGPASTPMDSGTVTRGKFMSKSGKTRLFAMVAKFQGKDPCPKCHKPFKPGVDYICKLDDASVKTWYCVPCATGYTNQDMPAILANYAAMNDRRPAASSDDPDAKRPKLDTVFGEMFRM